MKTFVRLIRRYVLAAVGIVLLLLFSGVAVLGWLGWQEGCRLPQREYSSSEIADSMVETAEGLAFGAERTPQEWMNGYEWAMVLDDVGNIRWSYGLPQDLNHAYTPGDIAKFSRWYLADYPVFCWTEPYGLFVIGLPKGSLWKYSIYSSPDFALSMVRVLPAAALGLLMLGLVLCFWLSWRGAKRLETVANGLDALAQGQTVRLPTDGFAGELAEKLTQLLFCDLSTPKNDGNFNVYDDIRKKLIAAGVPENEIEFIHNADTEAKKAAANGNFSVSRSSGRFITEA